MTGTEREQIRGALLWVIHDWLSFLEHRASRMELWAETPDWCKKIVPSLDALWADTETPDDEWMKKLAKSMKTLIRFSKDMDEAPTFAYFLKRFEAYMPVDPSHPSV